MSDQTPVETVSADTHVFIGTFRPRIESIDLSSCPVCGKSFVRPHWENPRMKKMACLDAGHFDHPVYRTIEEVVRMRNEPT